MTSLASTGPLFQMGVSMNSEPQNRPQRTMICSKELPKRLLILETPKSKRARGIGGLPEKPVLPGT